ncbi:MAG: hypothetical protein JW814_09225 [Candidatus Krumholzibacteriota bacterium]|nr:hypothetical protein [Candidatus Krumholzibacteriota bacterium]
MKNGSSIGQVLIVFGSVVIIAALIHILNHLSDQAIYQVGFPGVIAGLAIFLIGFKMSKGISRDRS